MKNRIMPILLVATLLTCAEAVQSQTAMLRYGQIPSTVKSVSALHFHIAQRKALFVREGIHVEMIAVEGGAANMMRALDQGTVDITRTASFFLIEAALKGSEGVAIASETATPIYSLMVKPEIKTFADLKGKVLGLTNSVSTISVSMRKLLALHGLRDSDYRVIEFAGKIPVLVDGDLVLTESVAIVVYLAEKYSDKGLLPTDVRAARPGQPLAAVRGDGVGAAHASAGIRRGR